MTRKCALIEEKLRQMEKDEEIGMQWFTNLAHIYLEILFWLQIYYLLFNLFKNLC
jgi:hypothetical protein